MDSEARKKSNCNVRQLRPGISCAVECSIFIQDLSPDDGQLVRLGPACRPFQTFTSTKPRARLGVGVVRCEADLAIRSLRMADAETAGGKTSQGRPPWSEG